MPVGTSARDSTDFAHTGPGTLAGRYLRSFWQPVARAQEDWSAVEGRTDIVNVQDHAAQAGQGLIADRTHERLGHSDQAIILLRRIWARELQAFAEGRPLKEWQRTAQVQALSGGLPAPGTVKVRG